MGTLRPPCSIEPDMPGHQTNLVVLAGAADEVDLVHGKGVGLDVRAQPVTAGAGPGPARRHDGDRRRPPPATR